MLELGGNDAAIVRADADLERAAAGIVWSGFSNAGQSCGGAQRILVHESIYDAFAAKLKERVEALRVGLGSSLDVDMGCIVSARQKDARRVAARALLAQGARSSRAAPRPPRSRRATSSPPSSSGRLRPTRPRCARNLRPGRRPRPVQGRRRGAQLSRTTRPGSDRERLVQRPKAARELASRINAGAVMINDHLMSHGLAETPWGGSANRASAGPTPSWAFSRCCSPG